MRLNRTDGSLIQVRKYGELKIPVHWKGSVEGIVPGLQLTDTHVCLVKKIKENQETKSHIPYEMFIIES